MATLEKIRKQKIWLAAVIGLALLAFIGEAAFEVVSRFGGSTSAAEVGKEKIDIMDFQKRLEMETANDQQNNQQQQKDPAVRQQEVLDEMVNEELLNQEYEKLGLYVSDDEITKIMIGDNPAAPVVS